MHLDQTHSSNRWCMGLTAPHPLQLSAPHQCIPQAMLALLDAYTATSARPLGPVNSALYPRLALGLPAVPFEDGESEF